MPRFELASRNHFFLRLLKRDEVLGGKQQYVVFALGWRPARGVGAAVAMGLVTVSQPWPRGAQKAAHRLPAGWSATITPGRFGGLHCRRLSPCTLFSVLLCGSMANGVCAHNVRGSLLRGTHRAAREFMGIFYL